MEILREENGVYMTPYNKEQFQMICDFILDFDCPIHGRSITEENIDRIYEYLMNKKERMAYTQHSNGRYLYAGAKEDFELAKDIPSEIMKQFIISYANLDTIIIATRKVVERQSMSIDMSSIPTDLDMNDYEAVWAFADGHADENEDDYVGDHIEATWRLKVIEKVKVKRSVYKGWDLDQVLTDSFDKWWQTHSHLFEGHTPTILNSKNDWIENDDFLYIRIDKTSQRRDVQAFFNDEVAKQLKGKTKNLFKVGGKSPRVNVIQNNYNALVLSLKGWTPKEIHYDDKIYNRRTDASIESNRGDGFRASYTSDKSLVSNISKSKRIGVFRLMEVCEGRFGNSPDTNW